MKVTYNWLKDFVEIDIPPQELAEKLTMGGLEVVSLEKFEDDWIFEIEVTTNRPDWLSVIGIAREISALSGKRFKSPFSNSFVQQLSITSLPFKIKIEDKKDCLRYVGRVIDNIKIAPSPSWLQKRLIAVGLRPINNIVDITNYSLWETGQPMHAFDYDKIEEKSIIVRRAEDKETIVTIDGELRELDKSILVIADSKKPIAIAGIMGGKNSEVTDSTKRIFLESAYFDPVTIRRASQKLGLISESSYRFERKVDLETVFQAPLHALELMKKFASFEKKIYVSKIIDLGVKKKEKKKIFFNVKRVAEFLGKEIPKKEIEKILKNLGFLIKKRKIFWEVKPPLFRRDIEIEEDLLEEIARIYGYDKFPLTLPQTKEVPQIVLKEALDRIKKIIYESLIGLGFNEVITYSLVGESLLKRIDLNLQKDWLRISNPLSKEQEFLRPTLLASILEVVSYNFKYQIENLKIFEWGKIYSQKEKPQESPYLGICISGKSFWGWLKKEESLGFYDLKGIVELILKRVGIEKIIFLKNESPYLQRGHSAEIKIEDQTIGLLGKIKEEIKNNFDLPKEVYWAELDLNKLVSFPFFEKKYKALPKFPFVLRDISFLVEEGVTYQELDKFFKDFPSDLLREVKLIDLYRGENLPCGKKSLTFSLKFQSKGKTLRDEEVEEVIKKIRHHLVERFKAELR